MSTPHIGTFFNTSDNNIETELYIPCLEWATKFDRGVGYFTSGWLSHTAKGMASFAERNGRARWITSPIIEQHDYAAIAAASTKEAIAQYFRNIVLNHIDTLASEIETNTLNALAWMIFDGIIELRFAVPTNELDGDFHDKFGVFSDDSGNQLSFSGSMNDSKKGFSNYESIKIFRSWDATAPYVSDDVRRFERIWENADANLLVFSADEAIRQKIFKLRTSERPYSHSAESKSDNRWKHQDDAVSTFLEKKNGILEMATGTGKTRTALKIIHRLFNTGTTQRVVITMYGNDLLKQWYKECLQSFDPSVRIYKQYETHKELSSFLLSKNKSILIVSRDATYLSDFLKRFAQRYPSAKSSTLFVFDEVHGFGSESFRNTLTDRISPYTYRLGLSATPEREYDEAGNIFIQNEVGPVIFSFGLEDAIKKGILCEFSYYPILFALTEEDKRKKKSIIAAYEAKKARGEFVNDEDMYRDLAKVNKLSTAKLPLFEEFITDHPEILDRCLIFAETKDYGELVQRILINHRPLYHTYYGEDDAENLARFAAGDFDCLVTCKKISEGIDIKTVKNIILFSSDRSRLVTTQRIGRSLRIDPTNPQKRASVVDFICENPNATEPSADEERRDWLIELSRVRRENE